MKTRIAEKFQTLFQTEGVFYASAGRINLIGEHTDYNGGFVFPGAIDKGMIAEIKLNGTKTVRAFALDLDEYCEFGLNEEDAPVQAWARYIFGVCREIQKRGGVIGGFDTVFAGDVPLGAGMSSSAALESTFAYALNDLFGDNKNLSVSFVCRNLFFIYKAAPVDPDISLSTANGLGGIDVFNYPSARTFGLNIKLNL